MLPQQYCLRWKYHHSNLQTMFTQLLERQAFCDVTLACEGQTIKAHKMVLSACSTYFDTILSQYEEKDPILIMKDVKFVDIKCLVEFMYKGEINVEHCHLATLLKTAEELRIKGLAEVSWRDDENNESASSGTTGASNPPTAQASAGLNGIPSIIPQITMDTSEETKTTSRKRGRPPIDDYDMQVTAPTKISNLNDHTIKRNDYEEMVIAENDDWDDDAQSDSQNEEQSDEKLSNERYAKSENGHDESDTASHSGRASSSQAPHNNNPAVRTAESMAQLESQWPDVIKMNDYLNTGRRPQFWEEPFTKRVMDAIKSKELEMKAAAELLGVSYGTLYGRYRDAYGCLKHPYRVRDFWSDQGPADILAKLQRQEVTLFRAAELLNVTPQTLSNYLISLNSSDPDASTSQFDGYELQEEDMDDSGDDSDGPASSPPSLVIDTEDNKTMLPNHPDITIIKKDKKGITTHPDDDESDQ